MIIYIVLETQFLSFLGSPIYINTGWWLTYPSEKYEFVSWDDSSQYMENHKIPWFQTTNQLLIQIIVPDHDSMPSPLPASTGDKRGA